MNQTDFVTLMERMEARWPLPTLEAADEVRRALWREVGRWDGVRVEAFRATVESMIGDRLRSSAARPAVAQVVSESLARAYPVAETYRAHERPSSEERLRAGALLRAWREENAVRMVTPKGREPAAGPVVPEREPGCDDDVEERAALREEAS